MMIHWQVDNDRGPQIKPGSTAPSQEIGPRQLDWQFKWEKNT